MSYSSGSSRRKKTRNNEDIDSDSDDENEEIVETENLWLDIPAGVADDLPLDDSADTAQEDEAEEQMSRCGSHIGDILDKVEWQFEEIDEACEWLEDESAPCDYNGPE
jgi:hypothetical protein